jgi:phosphoesterase RecJ-like protein
MQNDPLQQIKQARYVLILTHTNPDADTISSALALSNFMFENKIKHKVFNISNTLPRVLNFLPRYEKITDQLPKYYDLVIYVDCADKYRVDTDIKDDVFIINIDHHQSNTNFGNINIVNEQKASNAEVLYDFFKNYNIKISKNTATCLYTGIYDDSNGFTTPRVDHTTFKTTQELIEYGANPSYIATQLLQRQTLAKYRIIPKILDTLSLHKEGKIATVYLEPIWLKQTGAISQECDDIVNMVLSIGIVQVVAYFRIIDQKVRVSLRSKADIDVSKIASKFNGGGHKNAAGFSVTDKTLQEAIILVVDQIK